jgi:hypothetical protein
VANKRARTLGACVETEACNGNKIDTQHACSTIISDGRPTQNHLWQCTTDVSAQRDTVTRAVHLSSDRTLEILTTRLSKLNKTRCMLKELCKHNQRNVT